MPNSLFIVAIRKKIMAVNILFLYAFPINISTYLCTNDYRAYCRSEKSEIAKIDIFHFLDQNPQKFEKKSEESTKSATLFGGLS